MSFIGIIAHVGVNLSVKSSVPALLMELAVRSTVDVQGFARIGLEAVIVPKVSVRVVNVHALLQVENVIQMFAGIAGSVVVIILLEFLPKEVTIMNVGT